MYVIHRKTISAFSLQSFYIAGLHCHLVTALLRVRLDC